MSSAVATVDRASSLVVETDALLRDLAGDLGAALAPVEMANSVGLDLDPWQSRLVGTTKSNTIVLCSRQAGKSTSTAFKVIHVALTEPKSLCLILSPGERQSQLMFKKIKDLYADLGRPVAAEKDNELSLELANGSEIHALPGKGDTVRGFSGVRLLVVDEASRVPDSLYSTVRPMLAVSGGEAVLLSTPAGKRGFFYKEWLRSANNPTWERIGPITAEDVPRISPAFLAEEREALPDQMYRQEYGCEFLDEIGQIFTFEQISRALSDATVEPRGLFSVPSTSGPLSDPSVQPRIAF
jgi:hypothetical protein